MIQIWALYRQSGSDRLEKQPTDLRQHTSYLGDRPPAIRIQKTDRRAKSQKPDHDFTNQPS
jgi:hypothetical protein